MNNYCKKNGYEFSISENYGRELCYSILDKYSVITWINYNYGWNKWLFYNFEFHVDIDDIDGYIECDEYKVIEFLMKERNC